MKLLVKKGATSYLATVFIQDSSSTTGAGLSGLVFNSSGLVCYRARADDGNAGGTAVSLATATLGTWATGGFKEKDATNMKGVYEIGITNASLAAGSDYCVLYFSGATNMAPLVLEIQLVAFDPDDAVHLGLTCLPNTAVTTNGSLLTSGTGTAQITASSGQVTVATNNDKTGYSLTQSFPSNFSSLSIDGSGNVSTTANIKKNTASSNFLFVMTDSTTHAPKTGVTVTGTVCIDGAAFTSLTNSVSEVGSGTYKINLAAADVNGNHIMLRFTGASADDLNIEIITQP